MPIQGRVDIYLGCQRCTARVPYTDTRPKGPHIATEKPFFKGCF